MVHCFLQHLPALGLRISGCRQPSAVPAAISHLGSAGVASLPSLGWLLLLPLWNQTPEGLQLTVCLPRQITQPGAGIVSQLSREGAAAACGESACLGEDVGWEEQLGCTQPWHPFYPVCQLSSGVPGLGGPDRGKNPDLCSLPSSARFKLGISILQMRKMSSWGGETG